MGIIPFRVCPVACHLFSIYRKVSPRFLAAMDHIPSSLGRCPSADWYIIIKASGPDFFRGVWLPFYSYTVDVFSTYSNVGLPPY